MNRREKRRAAKAMRAARRRQVGQGVLASPRLPGKRTMLATFSGGINVKHWPDVARARARQAAFFRDLRGRDHELARTIWRRMRDARRQLAGSTMQTGVTTESARRPFDWLAGTAGTG